MSYIFKKNFKKWFQLWETLLIVHVQYASTMYYVESDFSYEKRC